MKKKATYNKELEDLARENHRLQQDNNSMFIKGCVLCIVALAGITSTTFLAVSNRELTKEVRDYADLENKSFYRKQMARLCDYIRGDFDGDWCFKNDAILKNLEDMQKATLHFELGDKK